MDALYPQRIFDRRLRAWVELWLATLAGTLAAIAVAVQTMRALDASPAMIPAARAVILAAGGVAQGVLIAVAQWLVLHDVLPRPAWRHWLLSNAAGAAFGWLAAIAGALVLSRALGGDGAARWMFSLGVAALTALVLGAVFAAAQWFVLAAYFRGGARFLLSGALGWCLPALMLLLSLSKAQTEPASPATAVLAVLAAFTGAALGAAIIAAAFRSILRRPKATN